MYLGEEVASPLRAGCLYSQILKCLFPLGTQRAQEQWGEDPTPSGKETRPLRRDALLYTCQNPRRLPKSLRLERVLESGESQRESACHRSSKPTLAPSVVALPSVLTFHGEVPDLRS